MSGLPTLIDSWVPPSPQELYLTHLLSIVVFSVLAFLMGLIHHGAFDVYRVLRSGVASGAAFPSAIILLLHPVSPRAAQLTSAPTIELALMVGGATTAILIVYGVFKK